MSDPDIIPPSGTTKQEYVDQMVSQLERQNRNNSRAYSLLTPTASDTAEGGGSDMYVQINRIKKAAKMLQKSYDEEDYMQAIKLSMQQHADDYSFLKAKEEDPPDYKIVHRYQTKGAGDSRSFIVIDSDDLDAPITLTRLSGSAHTTSEGGSSQSWYPTYGYGQPYAYGNSKYKFMSLKHVQQLEDSILNDGESRQRHSASGISSTQDAFDTIFADWKDNKDIFPRTNAGVHKHKPGLQAFIEEAVESQEGPKREAYNKWMDHVKSLARSAPRFDKKGDYKSSEYGEVFKSEWGLTDTIAQVIRQSHHTWLSEGQPDSENMRHFNFPSLETMHVEGAGRQFKKADSPEGLINKNFSEDSSVRASLLPLMRIIHHINENSDIENSSVWKADATGLEAGSKLDEGDYEIHKVDSFLPENADNINAIHQNAINDRVSEGVITQEKADGALLNQPAFLERLKLSINPGNVIPKLAGILADKSAVHSSAQSFGGMLVNTIKGAPPTKGFDHPNVPSEAENSMDPPAELPTGLGNYLESGNAPISKDQFDSLSALRQHIFADRFQEMITRLHSGGNLTQENIDVAAEGLSDDLHKTKSDTYLSSDDLLSDNSPYKDNIAKVEEQFNINLTTPSDEAAVEDTTEKPVTTAAQDAPEDTATAEDEDAVDTEEVTPKDTAPVAQVEDDDKVSDDQTEDEELTDEEQDIQIESGGAFFDNFSDEEQQAVLEASKQLPDSQRANLIAFIEAGDFDQLGNFISDPTSTTAPEVEEDEPEVEQDAPEAGQDAPEVEEGSERGLNDLEQQALDNLNDITNNAANNLSPELQRDVAQAAVAIQRTTTKQIADARKKAEKENRDLTANQIEGIEHGGDSAIATLARSIDSGKESRINEDVQNFRGTRESYESATKRTTDQGRTGGTDGGGDGKPVVPAASRTTGQSGDAQGSGPEGSDENVDGDSTGGSVPNKVDDSTQQQQQEQQQQDETGQEETGQESGGDAPPPPPTNAANEAPEEESEVRIYRRKILKELGDKIAGLEDVDHHNYRDKDSIVNTLLEFPETEAGNQKFSDKLKEARETHAKNEEKRERTSAESNEALADSIRSKKGVHEAILEDIANHVEMHNGREINDAQYNDLDSYIEYFHSLPEDERRREMKRHHEKAKANTKAKEEEEAKAAETAETEATKQKEEEDKAAWATESRRIQQQMADMPTILGAKGKILDQWDNSAALHYFRNLNSIVWHDTRVNLEKAGVDTSDIKDLSSLLGSLGKGDRISSDIYSKITNSASAINAVLSPRQKRDLGEEMETVNDYMSERHRKQIATDNETSRNNEKDYQERLLDIVDKGMSHPIFSSTSDDNYREYPPRRMKRFNTIYEAGKIIPLFSDPEDMKKKDEAEALRRETDNVGEETSIERAKRRTSQGHPPTESPGEGYAYHPETGQWMDRERFDSMAAHFDEHLKDGETASFSPSNTLRTEHSGKDKNGKRSIILKSHEPLSVKSEGASDYISVTKNRDGKLIWSPIRAPEQNKHGFISPDQVVHDTGDSGLDERLNNAHAVGQVKGTVHAKDHEENSSGDHARHGMQNNIIRYHRLGGKAAPKNVLTMGAGGALSSENFSNIAGNILNFSRKHGASLAKKLKLDEATRKSKEVSGLNTPEDAASLLYNPAAHTNLYRRLLFGSSTKEEALGMPTQGLAGAAARGAKKVEEKVAPIVSDVAERASRDVKGVAERVRQTTERASELAADAKEKVEGKVQQGGIYAGEKVNQATSAIAEQTGNVVDRTKEGASQVGQDIASTGMASVDTDQPSSTGPPPVTSKNKLTEDPAQTQRLRGSQAKLKAIRERQNSGVGEASRTEEHGAAVDAFHNFTVENRAERDGITGTDAPDLTPVKPNRAQRRAAEGKGTTQRAGAEPRTPTTNTPTPKNAAQPRPLAGYQKN